MKTVTKFIAVLAALMTFGSASAGATPVDRVQLQAGFNGPVADMTAADSNGTRYFVGNFTGWDQWFTGSAAMVDGSTGAVDRSFSSFYGVGVNQTVSDGSGGWYVVGSFTCANDNGDGDCADSGEVARKNAAHLNSDGSVDANWNPQPNGTVNSAVVIGSNVYLFGAFTTVGASNTARNRAAAIGSDGTVQSWNPNVNGVINSAATDGTTIFIGGSFSQVGSSSRANAAALGTDGSLSSWAPNPNGAVSAVTLASSTVYLGGSFTTAGGASRSNLAAVGTDGTLSSWAPNPNNTVRALAVSGSTVYVGGLFNNIGGVNRNRVGAVTTAGSVTSWNPAPNNNVYAIAVSGTTVYLGGLFSKIGSTTAYYAGSVETNGTVNNWAPNTNNEVYSIAIAGSKVYLGGIFASTGGIVRLHAMALDSNNQPTSWDPAIYGIPTSIVASNGKFFIGGNFTSVGTTTRSNAVAVDTSGSVLSWNPAPNGAINAMVEVGTTLYVGGSFTTIGGGSRSNLAAVDENGTLTSWSPGTNGTIYSMAAHGSDIFYAGGFTTSGGGSRNNAAAADSSGNLLGWNPNFNGTVNSIVFNDDFSRLYAGGAFTTVGGTTRNRAAAVGLDGSVVSGWDPNLNNTVNAIALAGPDVFLGGNFTTVGSTARNRIAAVFTDGTLSSWNPNANNSVNSIDAYGYEIFISGRFIGISGDPQSRFWRYSLPIAPVITSGPSGVTTSGNGAFTWNGTSGANYECSVDGGAWVSCTSGYSVSGLSEGTHSFAARAIDSLGMYALSTTTLDWHVDTTKPTVAVTPVPAGYRTSSNEPISFSVTDPNPDFSECQLDGGAWTACTSGNLASVSDGDHTMNVRATDKAGNVSDVASTTWITDTTPPVVAFVTVPSSRSTKTKEKVWFSVDELHHGFAEWKLDGGPWVNTRSGYTLNVPDGNHTLQLRSTDAAGNVSTVHSTSWTSDATAPVVTLGSVPSGVRSNTKEQVTFNVTDANLGTTECQLDGGAWTSCSSGDQFDSASGSHTLNVRATDSFGNVSLVKTARWTTIQISINVAAQGRLIHTTATSSGGSLSVLPGNPTPTWLWQRCATSSASSCVTSQISRTERNHYMVEDDLGQRLRVGVGWYEGRTFKTVWSEITPTPVIPWLKVQSTIVPMGGLLVPTKGKLVLFSRGRMEGWNGVVNRTIQWQRCSTDGTSCQNIAGATGFTYKLTAADVGMKLKVKATLTANINHYLSAYSLDEETPLSATVVG